LYQSEDGQAALDVHLKDETVWVKSLRGTQFRIWATTILKDLIPLISADWPRKAWKRCGKF
jgi:hypothetical protein